MSSEPSQALAEAHERLRRNEELYRHVIDLSGLTPWTSNAQGEILTVGERWTDWTGGSTASALGHGWLHWVHPDDRGEVVPAWEAALRSETRFEVEYRIRFSNGEYRWCHARTTQHRTSADDEPIWYGTLEDCHGRHLAAEAFRRTQEELVHVSRLSAMGAMASAIAHEINQPLTAIGNYIRGSKRLSARLEGPEKPEMMAALDGAEANVVRAGEIVQRVRQFVHRGSVEHRRENLCRLVEEACRFSLVDAAAHGVSYRLELHDHCPVMADRVQIQQVIVNLIRNAIQAMEGSDRRHLSVATQNVGDFCEVMISDTGPGLTPEAAARMFDPFYTTREDGMGIGLSISTMIVESHGGAIWSDTTPGRGTTITFSIPVIRQDAFPNAPAPA